MAPKANIKKEFLYVVSSLILLVIFSIAAVGNIHTGGIENKLFLAIYNLPDSLRWPFLIITQLGSFWLVSGIVIGLLAMRKVTLAAKIVIVMFGTFFIIELLKRIIGRPRPYDILADIAHRDVSISGFGFPSGHTALAMAVAMTLWPYVKRKYHWLLILWPISVGVSRIYLGVHAPLDILGGLAVGAIAAFGLRLVYRAAKV